MGKGGNDGYVCMCMRQLMDQHPYNPTGLEDTVPRPYLLRMAAMELWRGPENRLDDERLASILLHTHVEVSFDQLREELSADESDTVSAHALLGAFARDVMLAYAAEDPELMAEESRRVARHAELQGATPERIG